MKSLILWVVLGFICYTTMGGSKTPAPTEEPRLDEEVLETEHCCTSNEPTPETEIRSTECSTKPEKYVKCARTQTELHKQPCGCEAVENEPIECPLKVASTKCTFKSATAEHPEYAVAADSKPSTEAPVEEKMEKWQSHPTEEIKPKVSPKPEKQLKSNKAKSQKPSKVQSRNVRSQKPKEKGQKIKDKKVQKKVN